MKNQLLSAILMILSIMIIPCLNHAQSETKKLNHLWVGVDFGSSSIHVQDRDLGGKLFNGNLNYNKGIHLLSLQFGSSNYEKKIRGGTYVSIDELFIPGAGRKQPDSFLKSSFTEINLAYGIISGPSAIRFHLSTGVSIIKAKDSLSSQFNSRTNYSGFGLPVKVGTIMSIGNLGIGINYFKNLNSYSNNSGVSISLMLGVFK